MTRDDDILAALEGKLSTGKQAHTDDILEVLGHSTDRQATAGELDLQRRGDDIEAVAIWAAKESAATSTRALAEAIMRADGSKGIYVAESEAKAIAKEAYAQAAKGSAYEDERHRSVVRVTDKLAETISRKRLRESVPKLAAQPTSQMHPVQRGPQKVSRNPVTGNVIKYY